MATNLSDQLDDFRQILLRLQDLPDLGPQGDELRVKGLVETLESWEERRRKSIICPIQILFWGRETYPSRTWSS